VPISRIALWSLTMLLIGCSQTTPGNSQDAGPGRPDSSGGSEKTASTSIYMRNSLMMLAPKQEGRIRIGASILGFSDVEIIEETAERSFVASSIASPPSKGDNGCRIPIAIVPTSGQAGFASQMLVMDTCGGNWLATLESSGRAVVSTDSLPLSEAWDIVAHVQSPAGTDVILGAGATNVMSVIRAPGQVSWSDLHWIPAPEFSSPGLPTSRPIVFLSGASETNVVVQGRSRFFLSALQSFITGPADLKFSEVKQSAPKRPYLTAFSGFDHLTPLPSSECGNTLLGVGLFHQDAGTFPRKIQQISLGTTQYETTDLETDFDVVTLAAAQSFMAKSFVIGIIGRSGENELFFAAYQLVNCTEWRRIDVSPTFEWRTPEAYLFKGGRLSKSYGINLLATSTISRTQHRFLFYDGYDLFEWTVTAEGSDNAPSLKSVRYRLHETRSDLSLGPEVIARGKSSSPM